MIFILNNAFYRKVCRTSTSTPIYSLLHIDIKMINICLGYTNIRLKYYDNVPIHAEYYIISSFEKTYVPGKIIYTTIKPCVLCINMLIVHCVKRIIYINTNTLHYKPQTIIFRSKHNVVNLLKSFYMKLRLK